MTKKRIALNIVEDIMRILVLVLMVISIYSSIYASINGSIYDLPNDYYRAMRVVVSSILAYFSIRHFYEQNGCLGYICAAAALTFEPIYHLSLGWVIWDLVDIIVIIIMVYMGIRAFRENHTKRQLRYHKDEETETQKK